MTNPCPDRATFKYRRVNGVTELKVRDSMVERQALAREFMGFGALLEGARNGQATFEELRGNAEFSAFIEGEGKGMETMLYVKAEGGNVTRRSILVSNEPGKVCAACSWDAEKGIQFEKFST